MYNGHIPLYIYNIGIQMSQTEQAKIIMMSHIEKNPFSLKVYTKLFQRLKG